MANYLAWIAKLLRIQGFESLFGMAKADRTGAFKQLPMLKETEESAVGASRGPEDGKLDGFSPKTQLLGPTVAVVFCNAFSRVMTSWACRYSKPLRAGYCDDFSFATAIQLIRRELGLFATGTSHRR